MAANPDATRVATFRALVRRGVAGPPFDSSPQENVHDSGRASRSRPRLPLPGPGLRAGLILFAVITALGLTWAKWDPYGHKLAKLWHARAWSGTSILTTAGRPAASPNLAAGWSFTVHYGESVWIALVAALLIAASVEAFIPQERIAALLARRTRIGGSLTAGLLAIPCMMCTCCSAPLAVTLRRRGVPTGSVLGYWLGNPVLNPAVLVFLALVAPWPWVVTRFVVGAVLVVGVTALIARVTDRRRGDGEQAAVIPAAGEAGFSLGAAPARFARTLARLTLTLVPEYFVVVLALGTFRGWLFPLGASAAHWGLIAVLIAAIAGTLLVIPTAGEIPILQGLVALGVGIAPVGALLITLPAISLPSMVMVGRALTWRVVAVTAAAVALTGLASAALLWALS